MSDAGGSGAVIERSMRSPMMHVREKRRETISPHQRRWLTAGVVLGLLMVAWEMTAVATAMPRVVHALKGQHLYSLPFALYLLLATVSGPLWGYVSDHHGRSRSFLIAVGVFLMAALGCARASSMVWFLGARAAQGLSGGGIQILTMTVLAELYPLVERWRAQMVVASSWAAMSLVGPVVGGFIVDHASWPWVFYAHFPLGLMAAVMVSRWGYDRRQKHGQGMDWVGAGLFVLSAGALIYGLQVRQWAWIVSGAIGLAVFVRVERGQPSPLVPLQALARPLASRTTVSNFFIGICFFTLTAYLPLLVQAGRGETATQAGMLLAPTIIGWAGASIVSTRLLPRSGPRRLALWGAGAMVGGFLLWAMALKASLMVMAIAGLVSGAGMGSVTLPLIVSAQEETSRERLGSVTAVMLFGRNVGGAFGSALMGAVLGGALQHGGTGLVDTFWRVPSLAAIVSGILVAVVRGVPALAPMRADHILESETSLADGSCRLD